MSLRRLLLMAIGLALVSFAGWLPINLAWQGDFGKAVYGAIWGAVGIVCGAIFAWCWIKERRP